ncbi:nuclear transport factor 2 family protein [Phenylobacterium sp.]|uniref:nuclear transport factor 2 family protein n=1 Tax=Phenylobacterium sp. TaxID=1871053 RepID=UPI0037848A2D
MADTVSHDEIVALETSYWDAMKAKDGKRTAALSGDPALVTGPRGLASIDKAKMGAMTEEGAWTLEAYEFEDIKVSAPAANVAIAAYVVRQTVRMNGKSSDYRAANSSTWVRGAGGWECHAHSETVLGDGNAA